MKSPKYISHAGQRMKKAIVKKPASSSLYATLNTDPESVKWTPLCEESAALNQSAGAEPQGVIRGEEKHAADAAGLVKSPVFWVALFSNARRISMEAVRSAPTVTPAVYRAHALLLLLLQYKTVKVDRNAEKKVTKYKRKEPCMNWMFQWTKIN